MAGGEVTGGLLLVRDVTEVRKRDKLLLSKDATIREVHHRVKNNLQTISSLLRLQARRLAVGRGEGGGRTSRCAASAPSPSCTRRCRARPATTSPFIDIVRPLLRLSEEGLQSQDRPIRFTVQGDGGQLPTTVATPLSVVLIELLQNAIDHGFPEGSAGGDVGRPAEPHARPAVDHGRRTTGSGLDPTFELEPGDRARAVDRAHPRDHRARRHHRDARRARKADFEAVGHHRRAATGWGPSCHLHGADRRLTRRAGTAGPGDQASRRWRAALWRRMVRRCSSSRPPQMPESWLVSSAYSRHSVLHRALAADFLGLRDLQQRLPGGADREEQIGIGVPTDRPVAPRVVGVGEREARGKDRHSTCSPFGQCDAARTGRWKWCTTGSNPSDGDRCGRRPIRSS